MQITRVVLAFAVVISTAIGLPASKAGDCINAGGRVQDSLEAAPNVNEKRDTESAGPLSLGSQLHYDADDNFAAPNNNAVTTEKTTTMERILGIQVAQPKINTGSPLEVRGLVMVLAHGKQQMPTIQQTQQPHDGEDSMGVVQDKSGWFRMLPDNLQGDNVQADRHSGIRQSQNSKDSSAAMPTTSINKQELQSMMQAECGQNQMDNGNDNQKEEDARLGTAQRGAVCHETTRVSMPKLGQANHKESRSHVDESAVLPEKQQQQHTQSHLKMAK